MQREVSEFAEDHTDRNFVGKRWTQAHEAKAYHGRSASNISCSFGFAVP